jgi:general secretion pathway protein G
MLTRKSQAARRAAFTLMEMLVVVAILVVLAGAAVPIYLRYLDQARIDIAKVGCKNLEQAAEAYKIRYGDYPASLQVLTQPQPDGTLPPLEATALIDPWQREFQYAQQGTHNAATGRPDVWSNGPRLGDANGMIGNWVAGR